LVVGRPKPRSSQTPVEEASARETVGSAEMCVLRRNASMGHRGKSISDGFELVERGRPKNLRRGLQTPRGLAAVLAGQTVGAHLACEPRGFWDFGPMLRGTQAGEAQERNTTRATWPAGRKNPGEAKQKPRRGTAVRYLGNTGTAGTDSSSEKGPEGGQRRVLRNMTAQERASVFGCWLTICSWRLARRTNAKRAFSP